MALRRCGAVIWSVGAVAALAACGPAFYTTVIEARRLSVDLRLAFSQAAEASNRAVMSAGEAESAQAADDAAKGVATVGRLVGQLRPVLIEGGLTAEAAQLDTFAKCFAEYEVLDREILALAADSTNLVARRLTAGEGQQAAEALRDALNEAVAGSQPTTLLLAARVRLAVLEIQVLEARHIPEADDAAMTRMETMMAGLERTARSALDELHADLPEGRRPPLEAARAALDRFHAAHAEAMTLSRRNSNVRSLLLSMGRKRALTVACDEALAALADAIAKHQVTGTR